MAAAPNSKAMPELMIVVLRDGTDGVSDGVRARDTEIT